MSKTCIAVDIGASSGRLISSQFENGQMKLTEVHRFKNQMTPRGDHFYWDIDALYNEIIDGLKKIDFPIDSVGIDTWAVDYVLVDEQGERVCDVYAYRDHRTDETMEKVEQIVSKKDIYSKTGIQFLPFNTLYQLFEHNKEVPEDFQKASHFLMVPDYLNFKLSGVRANEFTNGTSTQFFNINDNKWDEDLLKVTGVPAGLFSDVIQPGTKLGLLKEDIQLKHPRPVQIIAPGTHDTASAVAAVPALVEDFAYISSGTWSLMGMESKTPICTEKSLEYNFTNEGGVFGTVRVLKNIMGLWLIQEVKRLYEDKYSFAELVELAKTAEPFKYIINPNNQCFMNPPHMIEEIQAFCEESGQGIPETPAEIARCVFESLALQYKDVLIKLQEISGKSFSTIHIVGGGCQNAFLNQLCADFTGCTVLAGPVEATAIGNVLLQHIAMGDVKDLQEGRQLILDSFETITHKPVPVEGFDAVWNRFTKLP